MDSPQLRYELWKIWGFPENYLQGRNKLIVLDMSANKFTEVSYTTGCKISQGIGD